MDRQSRKKELQSAWRALGSASTAEGWRTIAISSGSGAAILAGRHFPDNTESLLVGFRSVSKPAADQLPAGRGFTVTPAVISTAQDASVWIALTRQPGGRPELFTLMADDVAGIVCEARGQSQEKLFRLFLERIRAWQDFMQRGYDGVLSAERETGLYGELVMLKLLLAARLPAERVVAGWNGPLGGLQDFAVGTGAVEVKAACVPNGFPAKVSSLGQLDDTLVSPLFIAGIRLSLAAAGLTLPALIAELRQVFAHDASVSADFGMRLLHAGYHDDAAERYVRRFAHTGTRLIRVLGDFPRLTRANTDIRIREAKYEIDLDLIAQPEISLDDIIKDTGAI